MIVSGVDRIGQRSHQIHSTDQGSDCRSTVWPKPGTVRGKPAGDALSPDLLPTAGLGWQLIAKGIAEGIAKGIAKGEMLGNGGLRHS